MITYWCILYYVHVVSALCSADPCYNSVSDIFHYYVIDIPFSETFLATVCEYCRLRSAGNDTNTAVLVRSLLPYFTLHCCPICFPSPDYGCPTFPLPQQVSSLLPTPLPFPTMHVFQPYNANFPLNAYMLLLLPPQLICDKARHRKGRTLEPQMFTLYTACLP